MTLIVNVFGGPGSGKSTAAAGLFHLLKMQHIDVELVTEYAKDVVWDEAFTKLNNQLYVFAQQHNRIFRCDNKVDVIVTDSPINLGLIYGEKYGQNMSTPLCDLIKHEFESQDSFNVLLQRESKYNPIGRMQSEEEALQADADIIKILQDSNQNYTTYSLEHIRNGANTVVEQIYHDVINHLNK